MAKTAKKKNTGRKRTGRKARRQKRGLRQLAFRWLGRFAAAALLLVAVLVLLYAFVNPPTTPYMFSEGRRIGGVQQEWTALEDISPALARSVVAAEDANFCLHWGFDMSAIRDAIADGAKRGGSTISQQTVKNVYLWQGRSWLRKFIEAFMTPVVEAAWSKRRILEVYLNVAEFGEGVFGAGAAARHYFGVAPARLTARQAALLATVLPDPKGRSAANPTATQRARARGILDGAATIRADGRAACFGG